MRRVVDRFVLGDRADPLAVVDRVGAGLEVAHDDPVTSMLEAVASAAGASTPWTDDQDGRLRRPGRADRGARAAAALASRRPGPGGCSRSGPRPASGRRRAGTRGWSPRWRPSSRSSSGPAGSRRTSAAQRSRVTRATLAERDRLRRDLHDGLGPSLSGIALGLEAASTRVRHRPRRHPRAAATHAHRGGRSGARDPPGARRATPGALDLHGLDGAVRDTASSLGMGRPGAPHFDLCSDLPPLLPPSIEEAAFRIAAESLTNVVRHSHADHCAVRLQRANGDLRLQVSDDGWGLGVEQSQGHGLDSMRRRAADVGGSLTIDPADPRGTVVTAVLPLEGPA